MSSHAPRGSVATMESTFNDHVVAVIKEAMAAAGIESTRELGRRIGRNSQYMSQRLDGGNMRTGRRVELNVTDLEQIAAALNVQPSALAFAAERRRAAVAVDFPGALIQQQQQSSGGHQQQSYGTASR